MKPTNLPPFVLRRFTRLPLLALSIFVAGLIQVRAAEPTVKFDVAAGEAGATLKQFARQAGREIMFPAQSVDTVRTNAVQGEYTVKEGLGRLLAETPLHAIEDTKTGALVIQRLDDPNVARAAQTSDRPESNRPREEEVVKLGEFEVFGSKLINADLPRTRDDVQPYVTFSREQLETSNALNLDDFFRTRLPMNNVAASVPSNQFVAASFSSISLRGLSAQQTLILIDGRRAPARPSGASGTLFAQADINGIPLAMIERVEILPSTASGIYGGSATGGVINIITRKDFSGVELGLTYANTFDTDAAQRRVDLNASFNLEGGKTLLTFGSSYSDGSQLTVQDRDIWQRGRARQLANNPAAFYAATTPPVGYTPNIRSSTGANLVLKPAYGGTNLGSAITSLPVGYAGLATGGVAPLIANAGKYNLDLANVPFPGGQAGLFNSPEVRNLTLGARRRFTANLEGFVDLSAQDNLASLPYTFAPNTVTLPVGAPNNPFTTPIIVAYPPTNLVEPYTSESRTRRASAGLVVRLPHDWSAGVDYSWLKSWTSTRSPVTSFVGDPDGAGPLPSYTTALTTGLIDVVRDLNLYPLNYAPYRMPKSHTTSGPFRLNTQEWVMRASGPIWDLPAGAMTLAGSVGWRKEIQPSYVHETVTTVPSTYIWFPAASVSAGSAYLEAHVPVFSETNKGLLRALEFQGSIRYDWSDLEGRAEAAALSVAGPDGPFPNVDFLKRKVDALSKTVGFKYSPLSDLTVRASWGTGFHAPTVGQLAGTRSVAGQNFTVIDPKRGGVLASTGTLQQYIIGGNPSLEAELSESLSGGVVFAPRFLPGLRLSLDYTKIDKTNEIGTLSLQQLFDYEDILPGRIGRDALTAQDQALGYTGGKVNLLNTSSLNIAGRKVVAYDLQADYEVKTGSAGSFQVYVMATYQQRLASRITPVTAVIENIGYTSGLRWRGNAGINWRRGPWSATWNMQYYDTYFGYASTTSAATIANYLLNQGTLKVPSQIFHDVTLGYQFRTGAEGWRHYVGNSRLMVGVQDIFNKGPAVLASTSVVSDRSGYGDPRMARYTISLRRSF